MNGIGILVLISIVGQIGNPPQQASIKPDHGWQLDPLDGALCYIVQVSPQQAAQMQAGGAVPYEKSSDMPVELVGRVTRVLFRIGNDELPQAPSLAEIDKMPRFTSAADVTAALEPGRFSDVESDAVYSVQDNGAPRLPANLGGGFNQPAGDSLSNFSGADFGGTGQSAANNLIDQANNIARSGQNAPPSLPIPGAGAATSGNPAAGSLADRFRLGSGGARTDSASSSSSRNDIYPGTLPGASNLPGTGPIKFESAPEPTVVADPGASRPGLSNWQSQTDGGRSAGSSRLDDQRGPSNAYNNPWPGGGNDQANYGQNPLGSSTPPSLSGIGIPNQQTPASGFGSTTGTNPAIGNSNPAYNSQQGWGQSGPFGYPNSTQQTLAQQTLPGQANGFPVGGNMVHPQQGNPLGNNAGVDRIASAQGNSSGQQATATQMPDSSGSSSDSRAGFDESAIRPKASEGILQVFFLLSLVVNFYLGMLIRKLLTRYRSLLASVRGQTA